MYYNQKNITALLKMLGTLLMLSDSDPSIQSPIPHFVTVVCKSSTSRINHCTIRYITHQAAYVIYAGFTGEPKGCIMLSAMNACLDLNRHYNISDKIVAISFILICLFIFSVFVEEFVLLEDEHIILMHGYDLLTNIK